MSMFPKLIRVDHMNGNLTGRTRYRIETPLFGNPLVILQVEVAYGDGPDDYHGLPKWGRGKYWRDARVEDLSLVIRESS